MQHAINLVTCLACCCAHRGVQETTQRVQQAAEATATLLMTPFSVARRRVPRTPLYTGPMATATPGLFTGPRTTPPSTKGTTNSTRAARQALGLDDVQEEEYRGFEQETPGPRMNLLDSLTPRSMDGLTPLHLKLAPPDPWTVQLKRRVSTFEEKMTRAVASAGAKVQGAGRADRGRASQGAGAFGHESGEVGQGGVSPLVMSGYIQNPNTGRNIKIGGDLYNRLLEEVRGLFQLVAGCLTWMWAGCMQDLLHAVWDWRGQVVYWARI